jgi:hypothetical protein
MQRRRRTEDAGVAADDEPMHAVEEVQANPAPCALPICSPLESPESPSQRKQWQQSNQVPGLAGATQSNKTQQSLSGQQPTESEEGTRRTGSFGRGGSGGQGRLGGLCKAKMQAQVTRCALVLPFWLLPLPLPQARDGIAIHPGLPTLPPAPGERLPALSTRTYVCVHRSAGGGRA